MRTYLDRTQAFAVQALRAGGKMVSASEVEADLAGDCEKPSRSWIEGRRSGDCANDKFVDAKHPETGKFRSIDLLIVYWGRCRQCPKCLQHKARLWRARALAETQMAQRTWFGTLTLSPDSHARVFNRAVARARPDDFDGLSEAKQFAHRDAIIASDLQRMLKRIRKDYGSELRYLIVAEAHQNGLPHYHMLMHQVGATPLAYTQLEHAWPLGHSQWRLVSEQRHASYLCKYLSKSAAARVRASQAYGKLDALPSIAFEKMREPPTPPLASLLSARVAVSPRAARQREGMD